MTTQLEEIKKLWRIKATGADSILELRAINLGSPTLIKIFKGRKYPSVDALKLAFEQEALRLNANGYNVYYVMNPIRDDFESGSAKDADIKYRDLLLIDIDKIGFKGQSSTDAELEAADDVATNIALALEKDGWGKPIKMLSGNGYHLYYIFDKLPNDDDGKEIVQSLLLNLADAFNSETIAVDTCVFNASRITKVPGTIARKGLNTPERPHRMARVL